MKFFVYLGSISYSIYMSHLFVFWILNNILKYIFNFKTFVDEHDRRRGTNWHDAFPELTYFYELCLVVNDN